MVKKNILLYIDSLMIGGMHKQTLYLAKYLNKSLFNVTVLTQNSNSGGLKEEFFNSGSKILDLGRDSSPSNKKAFNPFIAFKLLKVLKNEDIDVIYLNAAPNLIYLLIARLFLKKSILQIGSFRALTFWKGNLGFKYQLLDDLFAQLLYSTSNYTVVNSLALKHNYSSKLKINKNKPLLVINNGCDFNFNITKTVSEIRSELCLRDKDYFVLMAARLDPWKDFNTLLSAAKKIKSIDANIKFFIMGDGFLKNEIELHIENFDLKDCVFLIGEKIDSINYINACDISILSTHGEGFSNTILESMFLNKTVIATRVGGNIDMIGDSNNFGYLVRPKSFDDIVDRILLCKSNMALTTQIGFNSRERIIELCNISKYVKAYEELFLLDN
jgi:glycosyltransferase involved in cell wall biosynthesis